MEEFNRITQEVKKAVNGKDRTIIITLLALLANGNILIEDIPGVDKTTMAIAFSKALGLNYGRVQFSPDTLPSDITGFAVYDKVTGKMRFNKGAVFCNLFLADELNRTSSRTQAALLEAMEERQVTVEGVTYPLEQPFSVIATQNPVGASGTQLLPDSQTDRFMVRLSMGYPQEDAELAMLMNRSGYAGEGQPRVHEPRNRKIHCIACCGNEEQRADYARSKSACHAFAGSDGKSLGVCLKPRLRCAKGCIKCIPAHALPQNYSERHRRNKTDDSRADPHHRFAERCAAEGLI